MRYRQRFDAITSKIMGVFDACSNLVKHVESSEFKSEICMVKGNAKVLLLLYKMMDISTPQNRVIMNGLKNLDLEVRLQWSILEA